VDDLMIDGNGIQLPWLLCRAGPHLCALPLEQILEVMRPLRTEALADAPPFVRGVAVIRGGPVPVIDLARLLGRGKAAVTRYVTVRAGERILALAVGEVLGLKRDDEAGARTTVPLMREAAQDSVAAIGTLDSEALLFLTTLRLWPEGKAA
jgi:purine-binding chemotaxis protein CheW